MDVLSHCLEAVAATNASPVSTALAQAAFRTALELLPDSYAGHTAPRGQIHLAATMAGMAFDNAGLGACHALSHALGGAFHLPHGRLNGILLPHVVQYNLTASARPYASLAAYCGFSGARSLIFALKGLRRQLALPGSLTEAGLDRRTVLAEAERVCAAAEADPCARTNPRPVARKDFRTLLEQAL